MQTGTIEDVMAHAKQKGVGLLFWGNSADHTTTSPRRRAIA